MSPRIVSSITSLELVWDAKALPFSDGFIGFPEKRSGKKARPPSTGPIFPSLLHLRLSLRMWSNAKIDHNTGLDSSYPNKRELVEKIHSYTLPAIDSLVDRIAPPSTDVALSCPRWDWYSNIDLVLVGRQGLETTKPQRSEMEGLKCWRDVTTTRNLDAGAVTDGELEDGTGTNRCTRQGYWIHIPIQDVKFYSNSEYCSNLFL